MEVNKHICFQEEEIPELVCYLRNNGITYKSGDISSLDIFESSPHWMYIAEHVKKNDLFCISETIFSKDELNCAEWLSIRSQWRFGYPQPEDDFKYEMITYSRECYCNRCSSGLKQVDSFRLRKPPRWGRRCFAELNWVGDELFLNDKAKNILESENVSGISFLNVRDKKGKEVLPDIHQMVASYMLGKGLIEDRPIIRECEICPQCNVKKYVISGIGMLAFRKEIFEGAPEVVKTGEIFGSGYYAARTMIIHQRVYKIIMENHLERGLVFEPIELV